MSGASTVQLLLSSTDIRGIAIRAEQPGDRAAIAAVHTAAFGRPEEARVVDALRDAGKAIASLVAVVERDIVGHVLFSPVAIAGLGAALVAAGLDALRQAGYGAAVVLGDPAYYRRFGFVSARQFGLSSEYDAPEGSFMALELRASALAGAQGLCRYADEFRLV